MTHLRKLALGALVVGGLVSAATLPAEARRSCQWYFDRGRSMPARCFSPIGMSFVARPGWHRVWWGNRWAWGRPGMRRRWRGGRWRWG